MTNKILLVNVSTYLFVKVSEIGKKKEKYCRKKKSQINKKTDPFSLNKMHA